MRHGVGALLIHTARIGDVNEHERAACTWRISKRLGSRSQAKTAPVSPTYEAACVVLFPGAAHASATVQPTSGASAATDMQLLRSCSLNAPQRTSLYLCKSVGEHHNT